MAAANHRTRGSERSNAVSDTPRTDASAFGTDDESLNRLFGIRELPRYVVPVDFARILERELAAVTAERDVLKADLCTFAVDMERQLAAVTADLEFRRELGALQQQEYDKVTAERDVLKADLAEKAKMPLVA